MSSSDKNGTYIAYERSCGAAEYSELALGLLGSVTRGVSRWSVDLKSAPEEKHEPVPVMTTHRISRSARAAALAVANASSSSGVMLLRLSGRFSVMTPTIPSV